ncbi:recombinase family protein [Streptomyces sp. NPDC056638]|uniref:recombinase family protein n=1 Tax=Streptomyces sp. NPDC056638 TaxID=3345887 RepID=UPI003683B221
MARLPPGLNRRACRGRAPSQENPGRHTRGQRPKLDLVMQLLREGDTLKATRLDRLSRSVLHLVALGADLRERGIGLHVIEQGIDTATTEGRAMLGMLSVLAEVQRELIVAHSNGGLASARARGRVGGRRPGLTDDQATLAQRLYDEREKTVQCQRSRSEPISSKMIVGLQPLLFTFAFAYVMPSIGSGLGGATSFSTILLPGLIASTLTLQSIMSVTGPLSAELGPGREITDRALAPLPVWALGLQKITSSAIFGLVSSLVVVPIVWLVHAPGAAPQAEVGNWPLLVITLVLSALLASTLGLLLGTAIDASAFGALLGLLLVAATMLGCVYYPWTALDSIGWVQVLTLINPLVYMSEGLRANLTPATGHMPTWAYLTALTVGTAALGYLALRRFTRRVRT